MSRIDESELQGWSVRARRRARAVSALGAVLAFGAVAEAAPAAFVEPPPLPHEIVAFPDRDFVVMEGYAPNTAYTIRVLRNGVTIGSAAGTTDATGLLEANHPGGVCWQGSTPNIIAQDKIVVAPAGAPGDTGDAMTVADLNAAQAVIEGSNVVVRGTARNADGSPMDLGLVEQRIINPGFRDLPAPDALERRDIRAILGGDADPNGELVAGAGGAFTATYDGLTAVQRTAAVEGQTRVLGWQATNAAGDRLGITIHEVGEIGGPGFGGCPGAQDWAVTGTDQPAITKAMQDAGSSLTVSGVSRDAVSATATLSDGSTSITIPVTTLTPAPGGQTWTATFSAADLAALADGTITASASYTVPATENPDPAATVSFGGVNRTLAKDTVAPGEPIATPAPGTYATSQAVTLEGPDPSAEIHFTVGGADPSSASNVAPAQFNVTSSLTIKAIAVDGVGNTSAIQSFAYVIGLPPQGAGGTQGAAGGTGAQGAGGSSAAATAGGSAADGTARPALALRALGTAPRVAESKAQRLGLRVVMRVPDGAEVVRIKIYRKTKKGLKLLSDGFRSPGSAGLYRVSQSHLQLRRLLKRGSYEIQVTPGYSKGELGKTSRYLFKVV